MRAEPDEAGQERVWDAGLESKIESGPIRAPQERRVGGGEQRRLICALSCRTRCREQADERCKLRPWSHSRVDLNRSMYPLMCWRDVGRTDSPPMMTFCRTSPQYFTHPRRRALTGRLTWLYK